MPPQVRLDCALVDLEDGCGLRESLAGYEAALIRARSRFVRVTPDRMPPATVVIVPGCERLDPSVAEILRSPLEAGALVLLESGAAHAEPAEFEAHRMALDSHFGLKVDAPVDLWSDSAGEGSALPDDAAKHPRQAGRTRVPYVDYTWPIQAKVRDFSRVVPLCASESARTAPGSEPIGWAEGRPMAARQILGKGTLVYLGSPLGPALRYGDREAERWLSALMKAS